MLYCTASDCILRFGADELVQLTDRNGASALDYAVLDEAIKDACATIDVYLLDGGYILPAAPVTHLTRQACILARAYLYNDKRTEQIEKEYQDLLKWLAGIAKGTLVVPGLSKNNARMAANSRNLIYTDSLLNKFTLKDTGL